MEFPALEVLAVSPASRHLAPGVRWPLTARFTVGRARENDLPLEGLDSVGRRHFLIEKRYGRWWLLHLGSSVETLHNGVPVTNVELSHLDVVGVRGAIVFRFLAREEPAVLDEAMESAIFAEPDDDSRWGVYADWLLERGAALGERLSRADPAHHGRWLGELAPAWADGDLEVDWHRGLPSRLVVRRLRDEPHTQPNPLVALSSNSVFRFLRALEIDIEALTRSHTWDAALRALLEPLRQARLPQLGSLKIGPLTAPKTAEAEALVAALARHFPALRRVDFFTLPPRPELEVLTAPSNVRVTPAPGGRRRLVEGSLAGKLRDCTVRIEAPEGHPAALVAVRFARSAGTWSAEDLFARMRPFRRLELALKVNGHEVVQALLRPGDLLELSAGLLVRFCPPAWSTD